MTVSKKEQAEIDKRRAAAQAQAKKEAEAAAAAKPEPKKQAPYTVADGCAITTKRGILGPGKEIKAEDVANGQKCIDSFVKSGQIIKA